MAQTIKLKRSATEGKVPTTSQLALGEIAINTYDGRIFFEKNDGSATIEHIVTTDSITTGSITITGTTQTGTLTTTNRIDKQYLDDEVLNTSLNTFTGSAITITGNGTSGSVAVFNDTHEVTNASINSLDSGTTITHGNDGNIIFTVSGSNGELLTITDSNSGNLLEVNDSSGIDVFTVSATGDVSASGAITASGVTGLTSLSVAGTTQTTTLTTTNRIDKQYLDDEVLNTSLNAATSSYVLTSGNQSISGNKTFQDPAQFNETAGFYDTVTFDSGFIFDGASEQASSTNALMINLSGNAVGYRALGSNAFNSTSFGTGSVTNVTVGTGLDVSTATTVPNITLDLSELTDMSDDVAGSVDELIILDNGAEKRKVIEDIKLSQFNNDSGFLTSTGSNAQTVGGISAGSFLRSDATDTATGNLTFSGNNQFDGTSQFGGQVDIVDAAVFDSTVEFSNLTSSADTTAVMLGSDNQITKRTLGSNAFNSTTITPDGGNADQVDGLHASSFIRSDANDTATGNITFEGTVDVDSQFNAGANIVPQADNTGEVGTSALTFNDGRFTNFTVDSQLYANTITADTMSINAILSLDDNDELRFGTGNDFIIEDNGTDTLFKSTRHGGEVYFQNENASGTNQNTLILGTDTGNTSATYVELRYNNVERIKTTTNGSDMAGIVNFNGTTQSTNKTTGTVIIDGGVGIAKTLNVGEDVVAYASSDERYKDNVTPIENPNEKLKQIGGYTFDWNDNHEVFKGQHDVGVIAQEIEKVLPEIVETRESGYKAVKYEKIVALLIESNKELLKRIEDLESKIK